MNTNLVPAEKFVADPLFELDSTVVRVSVLVPLYVPSPTYHSSVPLAVCTMA